jgi:hypothetical protein
VDDDLQPTWTPQGTDSVWQAETMRELRGYAREGAPGRHALGELLLAQAYGHRSLSDDDMARAAQMSVSEVRQIIQERLEHHRYCQQRAAEDRVARHGVFA